MFGQYLNTHRIFKRLAKALVAHTILLEISCSASYDNNLNSLELGIVRFSVMGTSKGVERQGAMACISFISVYSYVPSYLGIYKL